MKNQVKTAIRRMVPKRLFNVVNNYRHSMNRKKLLKEYAGKGVVCPICNSEFRNFAPYGLKERNAFCPACTSVERHRLLWLYLQEKGLIFKEGPIKLLHFAPEPMFYEAICKVKDIQYYPVDLYPELYDFKPVKTTKADITDIPFEDNFFDVILCNHVLEHIPDDARAMSEMYRVLNKENGWGIFQIPMDYENPREKTYEDWSITSPEEREKAFGQHDHVRWYGKDYSERLQKAGFKVHEEHYLETLSEADRKKYGLEEGESIFRCTTA